MFRTFCFEGRRYGDPYYDYEYASKRVHSDIDVLLPLRLLAIRVLRTLEVQDHRPVGSNRHGWHVAYCPPGVILDCGTPPVRRENRQVYPAGGEGWIAEKEKGQNTIQSCSTRLPALIF